MFEDVVLTTGSESRKAMKETRRVKVTGEGIAFFGGTQAGEE